MCDHWYLNLLKRAVMIKMSHVKKIIIIIELKSREYCYNLVKIKGSKLVKI